MTKDIKQEKRLPNVEDRVEEFAEKNMYQINYKTWPNGEPDYDVCMESIKPLIKDTLTQDRTNTIDACIEVVESKRKDRSKDTLVGGIENAHRAGFNGGYNQALDDIIKDLKALR